VTGTYNIPLSQFASSWTLEAGPLAAAALALTLFAQAFIRLRRRGRTDHASWDRALLFVLGVAVSVFPLVSPIDVIGDRYLISAHMVEHVMLGDAGPALMVCAVRGPLAVFLLPNYLLRPLGHSAGVRRLSGVLLRPQVTVAAWVIVMGLWHIPAAYDYTLTHQTVHDLEHLSFAFVGTLLWVQLIDPTGRHRLSTLHKLLVALAVFGFGQILADALIFPLRPLYPSYADQPARVLGLSPVLDQQLAGFVMTFEQSISLGICCAFLVRSLRRSHDGPPASARSSA
jgi:putative membrane protein